MEIKGTKKKYRCSREQKENMCVCMDTQTCPGVYEINPRGVVGPREALGQGSSRCRACSPVGPVPAPSCPACAAGAGY